MMPRRPDGHLRAYLMSVMQINVELSKVGVQHGVVLGHLTEGATRRVSEYDQFEVQVRQEAAAMSEAYEVFYCLENSIRTLVTATLLEAEGAQWWNSTRVDENRIRKPAFDRRKKEVDSAFTPRSDALIDYTTFGELAQLITDNWDLFDTIFSSKAAVSRITNDLNTLRGPIAHCTLTDRLEQERLNLAVKTWFKTMS